MSAGEAAPKDRPTAKAAAKRLTPKGTTDRRQKSAATHALDVLTAWERHRIESVEGTLGRLPLYASREWWVLDDDDPRRWASVIRAAACWRHESRLDVLDERMRAELERVDQLVVERVRAASHDIAGAADWVAVSNEPSHDELTRRRSR